MNIIRNRCLFISEVLYRICRVFDKNGDYKINILLRFYKNAEYGHAWLTRNDRDFLHLSKGFDQSKHITMGQTKKFRYYINKRNVEKWANNELSING